MQGLAQTVHFVIWGPWTMVLFLGTGLLFTVRSGAFQLRGFSFWWSRTAGSFFGKGDRQDSKTKTSDISAFHSACTALAATIGTGNIVGVATALAAGGPGALFWMWISDLWCIWNGEQDAAPLDFYMRFLPCFLRCVWVVWYSLTP